MSPANQPDMLSSPLPRLILTGPESTGKSTLATVLAEKLDALVISEYLRDYFEQHGSIGQEDCIPIAQGQWRRESDAAKLADNEGKPLICDTDLISSLVYNDHYYKHDDPALREAWEAWSDGHLQSLKKPPFSPRLYLLSGIDWLWVADEQRDAPHLRAYFYDAFKAYLQRNQLDYLELSGDLEERLDQVLSHLQMK